MSELKDFWNSIPTSSEDDIDINGALDTVLARINRRKRIGQFLVLLLVPVLALGVYFVLPSKPEPEMLQCYAPISEHRTVTLADGTEVILNSGSTLVYSSLYSKGERVVSLSGEAKFNVAKNPKQPFVVRTKDFDVRVLGTVFDVSSYAHRQGSSVVLESGLVVIEKDEKESRLYPGQKAEYSGNGAFLISNVETAEYMAWTNGGFTHRQATIYDIMDYIRSTYGLEVRCNFSPKYRNAVITLKSESRLEIEKYLSLLSELIPGMRFQITDNILTLN